MIEMKKAIENPKFYHIGLVVKDTQETIKLLEAVLPGIYTTSCVKVEGVKEDIIVGAPFKLECTNLRLGRIAFELVCPQPDCDPEAYQVKALKEHGEGFHHVAYVYPKEDFDTIVEQMLDNGYEIVFASKMGGGVRRCYYLAPKDKPGMVIELLDGTAKPIDY